MPVKLIATDLDGTFFGADHRPTPRNVDAINAAAASGIAVAAVTGRSWFTGLELATSTGARLDFFIGSNGGHRLDLATDTMEERLVLTDSTVHTVIDSVSTALGSVGFAFETATDVLWDSRFVEISPVGLGGHTRHVAPDGHLPPTEVGKMFVAHPEVEQVELVELVQPLVPSDVNVTTSGSTFVELTPPGADKGTALARLVDLLEIDASEVIAFGDNQNDLTMLQWAGRGVAMGNALDIVKNAADETTVSNVDDGVARVIETILGVAATA